MKRQYLGDSKDCFKWDYHDFLVDALGYKPLKIVWMMTDDDGTDHGTTCPEQFHAARPEIIEFCRCLKKQKNPDLLSKLPKITNATYQVSFHEPQHKNDNHSLFSTSEDDLTNQVVFIDPDNGFEPKSSCTDKHIRYDDIETLLENSKPSTILIVFQHFRRKKFPDDFKRIRERLKSGFSSAIYWDSVMFVCISPSGSTIDRVREINECYAEQRQVVETIA